ncbi:TIC 56, chloroplastic-like protein, partial [Drosera capensis]
GGLRPWEVLSIESAMDQLVFGGKWHRQSLAHISTGPPFLKNWNKEVLEPPNASSSNHKDIATVAVTASVTSPSMTSCLSGPIIVNENEERKRFLTELKKLGQRTSVDEDTDVGRQSHSLVYGAMSVVRDEDPASSISPPIRYLVVTDANKGIGSRYASSLPPMASPSF